MHLRYDAAHFPEDLVFQETGDRGNFQGRYVLRHPWTGDRASVRPPSTIVRSLPNAKEPKPKHSPVSRVGILLTSDKKMA